MKTCFDSLRRQSIQNFEIILVDNNSADNYFDLILMDVQMPNLDGLEATRQIRGMPGYSQTPIVAMTANVFVEDRADCVAAGMNDFLGKPFDPDTLFATLLRALSAANAGALR